MTFQARLITSIGAILVVAFVALEYSTYRNTIRTGLEGLQQQAEEIRGVLMSMRRIYHHQFIDSGIELTESTVGFLPAHAMNRISRDFLEWSQSGLSFNNVSTKPRNRLQKADAVETEAIVHFEKNPEEPLLFRPFTNEVGVPYYLYARPIWVEAYCLKCHGKREDAPETIRKLYRPAFDYQVGELRGILSIKLPAAPLQQQANEQLVHSLLLHAGGVIIAFFAIIALVRRFVAAPLVRITEGMKSVTDDNYQHDLGHLSGEFSEPARIFNQMRSKVIQQQDDLNLQLRKLELANRAKDNFLATMSHELRTPLTAIIGNSELLAEKIEGGDNQQLIHAVGVAGRNQLALVNDILDMSKIESGKFTIDEVPYDLSMLLDELKQMLLPHAQDAGIGLLMDQKNRETMLLHGDGQRVGQILINLIGNAIKFTEQGQVTLTSQVVQRELLFRVEDTGIGMSAEGMKHIFSRFEQSDGTISRRFGGSGLGLFIAENLADLMGGNITVSSREGVGSIFTLSLPYRPTNLPVTHATGERAGSSVLNENLSGHVLVVEDTPELQLLECRILEGMGLTVTTANNGRDALEQLDKQSFDLILMDMQMPVMDGIEATEAIRVSGNPIPIIALTANVMQKHRDIFNQAGCDGFMAKPIDKPALKRMLKRYLK
ncbi:MAG: DUF3365 domain-containing protein [Gammaproteobacteria bacterium]|nr:DUF3365 domain-containing protein [Gammaproteobacteria bacterium]